MCNDWVDFPMNGVNGATGGLIGNSVIICGGWDDDDSSIYECFNLNSEKATLVTHMSVGRWYAASIVLNDNILWVTGGFAQNLGYLATTEYVTVTGTMLGPDLPMTLVYHAMVAINSTCSMVIGGCNDMNQFSYYASTHYYHHNEGKWITGPSLMQARSKMASGIITDEVSDEPFIVVTGGYYYAHLDSTEIFQDGEWVQGKEIIPRICKPHYGNLPCCAN